MAASQHTTCQALAARRAEVASLAQAQGARTKSEQAACLSAKEEIAGHVAQAAALGEATRARVDGELLALVVSARPRIMSSEPRAGV
jgi:hypothetical protein